MSEFVLCYIDAPWAYFTTQPLEDQWGDDWDDAPYEHNAGAPYDPPRPDLPAEERANLFPHAWLPDGTPRWRTKRVAFDGDFITPSYEYLNSPWSVQRINRGEIAWLRPAPWSDHDVVIYAGTTLSDFIDAVQRAGGRVYVESVEIARLTRELDEVRKLIRELAAWPGLVWTGTRVVCAYCSATDRYAVEHDRDCLIERARRALAKDTEVSGGNMSSVDFYLSLPWTIQREERDDDGRYFVLRVAELPGFVVACEDEDELDEMFWPALRAFLESYVKHGETPPRDRSESDATRRGEGEGLT